MQGIRLYLTVLGFMVLLQGSALGQVILRDSVTIALHSAVRADIKNNAELDPGVKAWLERFSKDFIMRKSSDNNRLLQTNLPAGGLIMP